MYHDKDVTLSALHEFLISEAKNMRMKYGPFALVILLIFLQLAGCASAPTVKADPTALPYTPITIEPLEISLGEAGPGEAIFAQNCAGCHSIEEAVELAGPTFFGASKRLKFDFIKNSILNPHEAKSNPDSIEYMPEEIGDQLEPEQMYDVIAYIRSLK
jgi:mono/diheme cytochrome c family protein